MYNKILIKKEKALPFLKICMNLKGILMTTRSKHKARVIPPQLSSCTTLLEDQSQVPSTHDRGHNSL